MSRPTTATISLNEQELGHLLTLMAMTKRIGVSYPVATSTDENEVETPAIYWSRHNRITLKLEKADRVAANV